eukprot:3621566-Amphidinium_carterae.1
MSPTLACVLAGRDASGLTAFAGRETSGLAVACDLTAFAGRDASGLTVAGACACEVVREGACAGAVCLCWGTDRADDGHIPHT